MTNLMIPENQHHSSEMNLNLLTCSSDDDVVTVDDDDGPELVHEIGIVRLQPDVISCMEWIVCVVAVDSLADGSGDGLDGIFVFDVVAVVVITADVVDVGDNVGIDLVVNKIDPDDDAGTVDDRDKSGGGCFDRTLLKLR